MFNTTRNTRTQRKALFLGVFGLIVSGAGPLFGQTPAEPPGPETAPLAEPQQARSYSAAELEELVGRVALYPDDLIAIVLPAATYPLQVVQAARYLEALETDSTLTPDVAWDDSIVALLNYPEVLATMNEDLDWTWSLGEAVLYQQSEVFDAIQQFRERAYAAGNLRSDERQIVTQNEEVIEIQPANREVIYVPYYEPARVVVYQPSPVFHYYPWGYPLYYYPYGPGYSFRTGLFWGVTTAFTVGWQSHHLYLHYPYYSSHPYYGRRYHDHYYLRRPATVSRNGYVYRGHRSERGRRYAGDEWRPSHRRGARPRNSVSETRTIGERAARLSGSSYRQRDLDPSRRPATAVRETRRAERESPVRFRRGAQTGRTERGAAGRSREDTRIATGTRTRPDTRASGRQTPSENARRAPGASARDRAATNRDRNSQSRARLGVRQGSDSDAAGRTFASPPRGSASGGGTLTRPRAAARSDTTLARPGAAPSGGSQIRARPGRADGLGGNRIARVAPNRATPQRAPGGRTLGAVHRSGGYRTPAAVAPSGPRASNGAVRNAPRASGGISRSQPRAGGQARSGRSAGNDRGSGAQRARGGGGRRNR